MHIGFLTTEYPPLPSGGIGTSIKNLASSFIKKGHRVTVFGIGEDKIFDDQEIHVIFKNYSSNIIRRKFELIQQLRKSNIDILEAPDWEGISAGLVGLKFPIVIRCHGSHTYFSNILNQEPNRTIKILEYFALKSADSIAAVSQYTAEKTKSLFNISGSIKTIHNGIDLSQFEFCNRQNLESNTILYFGTIVRKKGVIDLCKAFSILNRQNKNARLLMVGRDATDYKTGLSSTWNICKQYLSREALQRVQYVGDVPYEKIVDYIYKSRFCVFPSYAEAFPLSWLESMACGKSIIAYNIGWAKEIIKDQSTGYLVELGNIQELSDKMQYLLSDSECLTKMGEKAFKKIKNNFTSELTAEESLEWYENVININNK